MDNEKALSNVVEKLKAIKEELGSATIKTVTPSPLADATAYTATSQRGTRWVAVRWTKNGVEGYTATYAGRHGVVLLPSDLAKEAFDKIHARHSEKSTS